MSSKLKTSLFPQDSQIQQIMQIKKYIVIPVEILDNLSNGKYVEGSLHRDIETGCITFNAYNRKPRKRLRDKIIQYLEHGWVKESAERIKVYESIPKVVGTPRVMGILDREIKTAKDALMVREVIDRV